MQSALEGDTVAIPSCSGGTSWTDSISWSPPANVTLIGAGTLALGGGDQTVIVDDYASNAILLTITVNSSGTFRMTGITIKGGSSGVLKSGGVLKFIGPGTVRIDHCHFDTTTYSTVNTKSGQKIPVIGDRVYGVIDHCILDLYGTSAPYIFNGAGSDGQGNTTWATATDFGGSDFFFIEDNQFNGYCSNGNTCGTRVSDGWSAAREVVRFNNLSACSGPEQHATGHSSDDRGFRALEVYGNSATSTDESLAASNGPNYDMASAQNGAQLIWGNSALNCYKNGIILKVTRRNNDTYSQTATPNGWGYCGTDFNGTGSDWDTNSDAGTGYICIDQPGRGVGDLLTGSFPNKVNNETSIISQPNQALEPIYIWNNDITLVAGWGGSVYSNQSNTASGYRIVADRDYYAQASGIQTDSSTPFDGTTGTGWGTLANRPTTCTTGVGYWATDQGEWNSNNAGNDGQLYKCTSTDTWELYYTPYTYPHPLNDASYRITGGGSGTLTRGTGTLTGAN